MRMSPRYRSPGAAGGIENGNALGQRPVVRQSKLYRERESGNAMKGIFGQDNLAWNTEEQQGVFRGQGVFDAASESITQSAAASYTSTGASAEVPYPHPGSVAACDACGEVVR